jgi:23S rRNA G2445 N2-methylase RlmL
MQSAFVGSWYPIPRPKALLGQQYWDDIISVAQRIMRERQFATLEIDAAGAESSVMQRIATTLASRLDLLPVSDDGELVVRIRPAVQGWEVLIRLTPRPHGTRTWRVCNMPGALNAVVAAAMVRWAGVYADECVLNMGVGSGTLLIERLLAGAAGQAWGCDTNSEALTCAQQNVAAADLAPRVQLTTWDATQVPLPAASVDVILADLPFGQLIGTHQHNLSLYPLWIAEAARLLAPHGRMALISHENRLLEQVLQATKGIVVTERLQVKVGGMAPMAWLIRRDR